MAALPATMGYLPGRRPPGARWATARVVCLFFVSLVSVGCCVRVSSRMVGLRVARGVATGPTMRRSVRMGASDVSVAKEMGANSRMFLKVTVPAKEVARLAKRSVKTIESEASIPGFRPGKPIPRQILTQYVNKKELSEQMVADILNTTMPKALREVSSNAIDGSDQLESSFDQLVEAFKEDKDFEYKIGVDLPPEVQWKSSYKGLTIKIDSSNTPENNEKMVEKAILLTRKKKATLDNASDREVQKGDIVMMSYMGIDKTTGEPLVELGGQRPKEFDTDDETIVPGFMDNIMGIKVEEIKEFDVTFPDNFMPAKLRGTTASFKAMVHRILAPTIPPEDDELAKELVPDAKDMKEARAFLLEAVQTEADMSDNDLIEDEIIQKIGDIVEFPIPDILIQENGQQMYGGVLMEMQQTGKIAPTAFNNLMTPELVSRYINDHREEIEHRVRTVLAFDDIKEKESLHVTPEQLEEEVKNMIENFEAMGMEYNAETVQEEAQEIVQAKKILDFLKSHATIVLN